MLHKLTAQYAEVGDILRRKHGSEIKSFVEFKKLAMTGVRTEIDDPYWQGIYQGYLFSVSGNKIYELSPNLVMRLMNTNLKKVETSMLRLPFKSALYEFPSKTAILPFEGKKFEVKSVFISEGNEIDYNSTPAKSWFGFGKKQKADWSIPALRMFFFLKGVDDPNNQLNLHWILLLHRETVEECVQDAIAYALKSKEEEFKIRGIDPSVVGEEFSQRHLNKNFMKNLFDIVLKANLYIIGDTADLVFEDQSADLKRRLGMAKSGGKRAKLERQLGRIYPKYKVGSKIILSREERYCYEQDDSDGGGRKLTMRFVVQGHVKTQRFGVGFSEKKLIYIEPYYKGPDFAQLVNKTHLVK